MNPTIFSLFKSYKTVLLIKCVVILALFNLVQLTNCAPRSVSSSDYEVPTEPPEVVETFNPLEWISRARLGKQIEIESLKLVTKVKLRYARTMIMIQLNNPTAKELQSAFEIILPNNAFFTSFQLKKGNNPKTFSAQIAKKKWAMNMFRFVHTKTNGTMAAGYVELSNSNDRDLSKYNLKFTLGPQQSIKTFLLYERQLERVAGEYSDKIHVYPVNQLVNTSTIGLVEFSVNVEELEAIQSLRCSNETEVNFERCNSRVKYKQKNGKRNKSNMELVWKKDKILTSHLSAHPFHFTYQLEPQNNTSAVIISQSNGNYYFVHLFVPEDLPVIRKHLIFLLDVSDSMHGNKLDQLKWSMTEILDDLRPHDFFNIIAFSTNTTEWSKFRGDMRKCSFPFPATDEFKESASNFISNKLLARGSTNIYEGLSKAFNLSHQFSPDSDYICPELENIHSLQTVREQVEEKLPENVQSMLFFLSDGKPTSGIIDPKYLLDYFTNLNSNSSKPLQIHTIAYGKYADTAFLKALSSQNGGFTKVINEESTANLELADFYAEISLQVLSQVQTSVTSVTTETPPPPSSSSSPLTLQITSPVTVIKGSEVITTGILVPPQANQTFSSSRYTWNTEALGKNGKLTYYNSPVYDCTNLIGNSLGKCVERIDFYLERLQAYQLLKKWLERDKLVEYGYICPKSYSDDDYQQLKMEQLRKYEQDEYFVQDDHKNCYNSFKQKAIELALQHKFVTPYTSLILTTNQIDPGLSQSGNLISGTPAIDDDSSEESMEYVPYPSSGATNPGNPFEKLIFMQSIPPPLPPFPSKISSQSLAETEESESGAPLLQSTLPTLMTEQLPTPSLLRVANENSVENYNETLPSQNTTTTANSSTNHGQSKSIFDRFQNFSKRVAKLVFPVQLSKSRD